MMHSATLILLVAPLLFQVESNTLVGGPEPAQLSDERRNELIKYAMDAFHAQSNTAFQHTLINSSITSQVVSGALYKLDLELAETDCRKGIVGKTCNLKYPDGSKNLNCKISIHEQPWLNHRSVTIKSCKIKS